jgi:shikimate kinase
MAKGPIWLVGMMGAGKSAVGPRLARRLGQRFSDTDAEIERAAGTSISEIFASEDETAFRDREQRAIEARLGSQQVVALGGGAIAQPGTGDRLARAGTVVYLKAAPKTLLDRLGDCSGRPLLSEIAPEARLAKLEALLAERETAYASATISVDTDGRTIESVVEEICQRLDSADEERESAVEPPEHA